MKRIMITCKEATLSIVKKEEGKINLYDRFRLFVHLVICQFCKLFEKQSKLLSKSLFEQESKESLTDEEKAEIEKKLQ